MTINQQWEEFRKVCIATNASAQQVADMRMAFFAGAMVTFKTCCLIDVSDEEVLAILTAVHTELVAACEEYATHGDL